MVGCGSTKHRATIAVTNTGTFKPSSTVGSNLIDLQSIRPVGTSLAARNGRRLNQQYNDSNNNFDDGNHNNLQPSAKSKYAILRNRIGSTLVSAALIGTTVLLSNPSWSNAIDLASISGGATALSSATNRLFASLSETGFYQAFSLVFLSEIGDKTFFIAGLLAMKTSRLISFVGSMGALFVMTLISVLIGQVFHAVPTGFLGEGASGIPLDDVAAVLAFAFFGYKTLKEALEMDDGTSTMDEELAEAEEEVEASDTTKQSNIMCVYYVDALPQVTCCPTMNLFFLEFVDPFLFLIPVFSSPALHITNIINKKTMIFSTHSARILSIFGLVFAAEFGDRSFLSTIALSAAQNPASVAAGAIAAHAVATGIAVSGGAVVAKYLSERVIGIIGGSLFIVFAVTTALGIF